MKPYKIIDNYCQLYGIDTPIIDYAETRFFVTISSAGANVLHMHEASKILGRVVCEAMKRGTVLYVNNGYVDVLAWEDWKKTWGRLFVPKEKKHDKYPEPNNLRPYRSEIFETMKYRPRKDKKPRKHGFERTFAANSSMERFSGARLCVEVFI